MYISRKLTIFGFVSICALGAVWYSGVGMNYSNGLGSSVLTVGGIDSVSCTDVPGKIQDLTVEKNIINTQLEQVRSELRSLSGQKSELDISSQQIQKEKERLTLFEHDFFKETKFDHADELRTSIQRISLNLIDLQEKITNSTNFIRNRLMNRKVRILEKLKEENTSLLTQYNEALNTENTKVQNKEGALSKASETLVQEIAQKENSRQNYETVLQQLETLQAQLINKSTICAQSVTQSAVSNGSTNTPQHENGAAQTEQANQVEQQAATSVANTPEAGASAVVVTNTPVVSETVTTNTGTQSSAVVAQTQTTPVTTQTETVAPVVGQTVPEQSAVVQDTTPATVSTTTSVTSTDTTQRMTTSSPVMETNTTPVVTKTSAVTTTTEGTDTARTDTQGTNTSTQIKQQNIANSPTTTSSSTTEGSINGGIIPGLEPILPYIDYRFKYRIPAPHDAVFIEGEQMCWFVTTPVTYSTVSGTFYSYQKVNFHLQSMTLSGFMYLDEIWIYDGVKPTTNNDPPTIMLTYMGKHRGPHNQWNDHMWVSNQSIQNTIDYYAFGAIHETVTKNWNIPHYIAIRTLSPGYRAFNFNNINGYGLKFIGCSHQNDLPPNL